MRRLRYAPMLAAVIISVGVIAGCGGSDDDSGSAEAEGQPGGSLTIAVDGDAGSLDPIVDDTYAATLIDNQIFDTLVRVGDNDDYEPWLAESWEQPNPTTYRFHLRDGVTFQDGTPFDAQAVKWNIDAMRDPNSGSTWQADFAAVKSVDVIDLLTVDFKLKQPYQPLLSTLSEKPGMMRSPTAVEKLGDKFAAQPVGTGPFTFVEWVKNDHVELEKNPNWWQKDRPYLDKVFFRPITDPTAKINDLVSGQVQMVDYVPPEQIDRVEGSSDLTLEQAPAPYNTVVYLAMNTQQEPMNDTSLRRAINLAIDRQSIVDNLAFGAGEPAKSMLSPSSWGLTEDVPEIPYDPDQARKLLGGKQYTIDFLVPPSYPQIAQVVEQNLADVGITAKIERADWDTVVDVYYSGDYQLELSDSLGNQRPDPDAGLSSFFASDGSLNGSGFGSEEVDRLLAEGRRISDQAKREEIYTKVQTIAQEEAPYAPLYHPNTVRAWANNVTGVELPANGVIYLSDVSIGG